MRKLLYALLPLLFLSIGSIASVEARGHRCSDCGTVEHVQRFRHQQYDNYRQEGRRDNGTAGMIIGALIGGALGNQVGKGDGRDAATVAGVVAGGVIGRNVDRNDSNGRDDRYSRYERQVQIEQDGRYDDRRRWDSDDRYGRDRDGDWDGSATRILIRFDTGRTRSIEVAGNVRIFRGDRVRVRRDRIVLLD